MLDLAQNSPPTSKQKYKNTNNTRTIIIDKNRTLPNKKLTPGTCSTNNASCKDEYWPEIRRTHGWRPRKKIIQRECEDGGTSFR